jgi:hypothetical protein
LITPEDAEFEVNVFDLLVVSNALYDGYPENAI